MRKRELSIDEKRLWRRVAEGVRARKPLPDAVDPPRGQAAAAPAFLRLAPPVAPQKASSFAPPADRAGEKRIRRGRVELGASLDLHGHTQATAKPALTRFLQAAQGRGERTVIIVTGVGRGGEGVLKRLLPAWLGEPEIRALVSGYAQAHRAHGGAGAYYVFLKRARI